MTRRYLRRLIYQKYEGFLSPSRIIAIKETLTEVRVVECEEMLLGKFRMAYSYNNSV